MGAEDESPPLRGRVGFFGEQPRHVAVIDTQRPASPMDNLFAHIRALESEHQAREAKIADLEAENADQSKEIERLRKELTNRDAAIDHLERIKKWLAQVPKP